MSCPSAQQMHIVMLEELTVVYEMSQTTNSSSTRCLATARLSDRLTRAETASCAMNWRELLKHSKYQRAHRLVPTQRAEIFQRFDLGLILFRPLLPLLGQKTSTARTGK